MATWAYAEQDRGSREGRWRVLHTFKAPISCAQQSVRDPRLVVVGCGDGTLHLYDRAHDKVRALRQSDEHGKRPIRAFRG